MINTHQELFDQVVAHALTMPRKSAAATGRCLYRTINGNACFIGGLIPADRYSKSLEDLGGYHPDVLDAASINHNLRTYVEKLQVIHDHYHPIDWPSHLLDHAKDHNLTVPAALQERYDAQH